MTAIVAIREQHRFDEQALAGYLAEHLTEARAPFSIGQFQGGQSNPTFLMTDAADRRYVLRKKPPGAILPSAHAVEREYAAMRALGSTTVPVPRARVLCEDAEIIGTPFYVMDYIDGRVLADLRLAEIPKNDRQSYYFAAADGLAALHRVDWRAAGTRDIRTAGRLLFTPDRALDEAISRLQSRTERGHGFSDRLASGPFARG